MKHQIRTYQSQCLGLNIKLVTDKKWVFVVNIIAILLLSSSWLYIAVELTQYTANQLLPLLWKNYPSVTFFPTLIFVVISDVLINGAYWAVLLLAQLLIAIYRVM